MPRARTPYPYTRGRGRAAVAAADVAVAAAVAADDADADDADVDADADAAASLASGYFAITTLDASAAGVLWFFGLALRPHSTRAIALLSLSVVGRTVIASG